MKTIRTLVLLAVILPMFFSCSAQSADKKDNTGTSVTKNIQVYYFHFTRRCATCNAVEEKTLEFLKELYATELENKTITFASINLDEDSSKELAEKLLVTGQALLFIKGDNKIDLTTDGFLNALSNPEALKGKVKETIDGLL